MMEKAVDQKADEIIPTEQNLAVAERRALALVAICQDSLYQTGQGSESTPVDVTVIVEASSTETNAEKGVSVWPDPGLDRERSKRSSVRGRSTWSGSARTANRSIWDADPGP